MTFSLSINVDKAARTLGAVTTKEIAHFRRSVVSTTEYIGDEIKRRGDADIRRAGEFSSRWTDDFEAPVFPISGGAGARIKVHFRSIWYAHIHEFGGTVRGRPLLWIPLSFGDAPKIGVGSGKVRARDYPGRLFRIDRPGKNPLLFSETGPQYVGVTHVTLRPRFHLRALTANVVRTQLSRFFHGVWSEAK